MLANLTGWHGLAVLAIILLIFGASKLPALAKSVGQSMRILRTEVRDLDVDPNPADPVGEPSGAPGRLTASGQPTASAHTTEPAEPAERT
ncbi:twin-arginine translocase TatA/TatE family subunit [Pseudoclavibacter helvolus]|uniref:twin-arginine translocase TatA/TatE family subunit n=1 Tax=Pseudoclavibacter helvolus TaxID=255205 RepID=UPI003C773F7D